MAGKIYYLLATQHNNMGDLLINKMLIDEISKYGDVYLDAEGVDSFKGFLINDKVSDANRWFGGSLKRSSFMHVLRSMNGFTHFFTSAGPSGRILTLKDFINQVYLSFIYTFLKIKGVKIYQVGTDLVLKSRTERLIAKYNNKLISSTLIRSESDVESAKKLGLKFVDHIPDMAFLYSSFEVPNLVKKSVLISFRDLGDMEYEKTITSFLDEAINYFTTRGLTICFFYQVGSDRDFNFKLYSLFADRGVTFNQECLWFDDIQFYRDSKYVISNRLHVLLLGLVHHSIPLSILNADEKTSKIKKIFTDLGLEATFFEHFKTIENIDKQYDALLPKIVKVASERLHQCQRMIQAIFEKDN